MRLQPLVIVLTLMLALAGAGGMLMPARAQTEDEGLSRVTKATVLLIAGDTSGSGTIITPSGLILTNFHVVSGARAGGVLIEVHVYTGRNTPPQAYRATVIEADRELDIAVLQIIADGEGSLLSQDQISVTHLPVGNSDQLEIGDDIYIAGYPRIGGQNLTITKGIVGGFQEHPEIGPDAWIKTDAEISGGSSGGAATNELGVLVAIPTRASEVECRQSDTNQDGRIDSQDGGCVPSGGAVGFLRPINFAKPLLLEVNPDLRFEPAPAPSPASSPTAAPETPAAAEQTSTSTSTPEPTFTPTPEPTSTPTPVPTPAPPTASYAIASTLPAADPSTRAAALDLALLLPDALALPPGQSFRLEESGADSLPDIAAGFPNPGMTEQLLSSFGWQENAYRVFAADNPPADAAGWVELSIHRFATAEGAHEAIAYLAQERQSAHGHDYVEHELVADESYMLAGAAFNGSEVTIFARRGNLTIRATGIAPNGDPTSDVISTILIPLGPLAEDTRVITPGLLALLPAGSHLAPDFVVSEERARSASNTADTFADPDQARELFRQWGWLESASRVYTGHGGASRNGTVRFEAVVYRWQDPTGAAAALPYFAGTRAEALGLADVPGPLVGDERRALFGRVSEGTEVTLFVRAGQFLYRFTAIGNGDLMADLRTLLGAP